MKGLKIMKKAKLLLPRMVSLTLSLLLILTLAACGSGGNRTPRDPTEDFSELRWPTTIELANLLPVPKSAFGKIQQDASHRFAVNIGNTSIDEYDEYVDECIARGFTVESDRRIERYRAQNEDGYRLELRYEGDDIMFISIMIPSEPEPEPEPEDELEPEQTPELPAPTPDDGNGANGNDTTGDDNGTTDDNNNATGTDWREFLRLYEEWVDEYIAFMEKYNADPTNLSLLTDYLKFMEKTLEWAEMIEELEDELTGNDLREYLAAMTRILQKLSAIEL
jgi:hypothetical protein